MRLSFNWLQLAIFNLDQRSSKKGNVEHTRESQIVEYKLRHDAYENMTNHYHAIFVRAAQFDTGLIAN